RRLPALIAVLGCAIVASCAPKPRTEAPRASRTAFPAPASVRIVRDVVYARYGERRLSLDLYLPAESPRRDPVPGVIVVRGGGWQSGHKGPFGFIRQPSS